MITYFHNPNCSKSRKGLALLSDSSLSFIVQDYLKHPPTRDQLTHIVRHYNGPLSDLLRESLPDNLNTGDTENDVIMHVLHSPKTMQRPLLVSSDCVVVGRPIEEIITFIRDYRS